MRRVAPDLAGSAYQRTSGNAFVGADGRLDSWILQTPDCWGQRACTRPEGIPRFLRTLERDLAGARTVVDLTTLIPFPFGAFDDAIVRGLRRAYAGGQRPVIRVLGGCAPPCAARCPEPGAGLRRPARGGGLQRGARDRRRLPVPAARDAGDVAVVELQSLEDDRRRRPRRAGGRPQPVGL